MNSLGQFYGIGVGPGPAGMIPVAALEALNKADIIYTPRARHVDNSIARQCLDGLDIPHNKFKEIVYNMDPDRSEVDAHYEELASQLASELKQGKTVAYLTIGDSLTYSTYSYLIKALLTILPELDHRTFPGVTSFAAIAAAFNWPLGQGKETILILPCPDDLKTLETHIKNHDVIVLMKIGHRLSSVLALLKSMNIIDECVFASRLGLPGEVRVDNLAQFDADDSSGYLSTMLIRSNGKKHRARTESVRALAEVPIQEVGPSVP